jgi:hypothetical protein
MRNVSAAVARYKGSAHPHSGDVGYDFAYPVARRGYNQLSALSS